MKSVKEVLAIILAWAIFLFVSTGSMMAAIEIVRWIFKS